MKGAKRMAQSYDRLVLLCQRVVSSNLARNAHGHPGQVEG